MIGRAVPLLLVALALAACSDEEPEPRPAAVLVILDELPVHSLMDARGGIDARLYPNFARLARDSTWFRNTTSVAQDTPYAVPAILDGRLPERDRFPVAADHPRNLFTLFAPLYSLHVREEATTLCAPRLCRGPPMSRRRAVAITRRVPRETPEERYVRIHANLARGRTRRFQAFVEGIGAGERLHVLHALLPHVPFRYLPSGRWYRTVHDFDSLRGARIRFLVEQAYQRHLLQLQATDRLLGQLLDRLHELGIYDGALVAVVADHGISFRVGRQRRLVRAGNVHEIAPVPFFVKRPGQERGRISDRPVETIDVLPTIADALDVRVPWEIDGRSALAPAQPRRRTIVSKKFRHVYPVDTPGFTAAKRAALRRKLELFGAGLDRFGPRPDLLGQPVPAGGRAVVARGGHTPAQVTGFIRGGRPGGGRTVAVAVNGRIAATGLTFTLRGSERERYSLMIPERALHPGPNRIRVLLP
jgi:Sulfatase